MADRVGEIVKIVWEDVASWEGGWIHPAEAIEYRDFLIITYGKVIYEDEHRIIVASEEHPDGERYANVARIPKVLVRSMQELK